MAEPAKHQANWVSIASAKLRRNTARTDATSGSIVEVTKPQAKNNAVMHMSATPALVLDVIIFLPFAGGLVTGRSVQSRPAGKANPAGPA